MGKNLHHKNTGIPIENNHPGCMWGILHVLHYHRWHYVKKMLPHKRHGDGRQAVGVGNQENDLDASIASGMEQYPDAEMNNSLIVEKTAEPCPAAKSSVKSRIKALISEEMSKRRGRHRRSSSYPNRTQLTRTNSLHHLEPSNLDPLVEAALNDHSPRIDHQDIENPSISSPLSPPQLNTCEEPVSSNQKCDLCASVLDMKQPVQNLTLLEEKLNNELFLKILQDPSSPLTYHLHGRRAFNSNIGLTKSVSFPLPGLAGRRAGQSKLQHKHETECCVREEGNSEVGRETGKSAELESRNDNSKPYLTRIESSDNSSPNSPRKLKTRHENKVIVKRFKSLKRKIKHAIRESRKESHRITMDAVLHKVPYGRKFSKDVKEEIADPWKEPNKDRYSRYSPGSSCESDKSVCIRRTSSFNESLDRHYMLFESSFNREAKHHITERLKLKTEETPSPVWNRQKSLGRILSLPELRSYSSIQHEDSPDVVNNFVSRASSRFDEQKTPNLRLVSESQENLVEVNDSCAVVKADVGSMSFSSDDAKGEMGKTVDDLGNLASAESAAHNDHEIQSAISFTSKLAEPSPISVLDSNFQDDVTSPAYFSFSEGSELKPKRLFFDEVDTLENQQNVETPTKQVNSDFPKVLVDKKDIAEFNYVRDVLQLSGFSRNEFLGTWHSEDQPVDPSVFEEVKGSLVPEPDISENEEGLYSNHLLLFDLINEVLLEIYERSFTYYPVPLSSCSHIRPMPVGYHVLEEVWENISWFLSWRPEIDPLLDDAVSRDLGKGDRWMNLQFDAECVGLQLEDMILDDLLDELILT